MSEVSEQVKPTYHNHTVSDESQEVWLMIEGLEALEELGDTPSMKECDWCGESSSSGYFVAVRDQNYKVCAICWGRSPSYVDFRREGHSHEEACRRLSGN